MWESMLAVQSKEVSRLFLIISKSTRIVFVGNSHSGVVLHTFLVHFLEIHSFCAKTTLEVEMYSKDHFCVIDCYSFDA